MKYSVKIGLKTKYRKYVEAASFLIICFHTVSRIGATLKMTTRDINFVKAKGWTFTIFQSKTKKTHDVGVVSYKDLDNLMRKLLKNAKKERSVRVFKYSACTITRSLRALANAFGLKGGHKLGST